MKWQILHRFESTIRWRYTYNLLESSRNFYKASIDVREPVNRDFFVFFFSIKNLKKKRFFLPFFIVGGEEKNVQTNSFQCDSNSHRHYLCIARIRCMYIRMISIVASDLRAMPWVTCLLKSAKVEINLFTIIICSLSQCNIPKLFIHPERCSIRWVIFVYILVSTANNAITISKLQRIFVFMRRMLSRIKSLCPNPFTKELSCDYKQNAITSRALKTNITLKRERGRGNQQSIVFGGENVKFTRRTAKIMRQCKGA